MWTSPAGHTVEIESVRLVSLTQRAVAAISYRVKPVDETLRLVVHVGDRRQRGDPGHRPPTRGPPPILATPLVSEEHYAVDGEHPRAVLVHGTRSSKLRLAAGDGARRHGPAADGHQHRVVRRHGPAARRRRGGAGRGAAAWSSTSATAGPRSGRGPR